MDELAQKLEAHPEWARGTIILRDESGRIIAYGWLTRSGAVARVRFTSSLPDVPVPCQVHPSIDG